MRAMCLARLTSYVGAFRGARKIPRNARLKILADILRLRVIPCTPNVSKLMPEIKVPTNVVFGTRLANFKLPCSAMATLI